MSTSQSRTGWFVLVQVADRAPRKVAKCEGEIQARDLCRALNLAAPAVPARPLYWVEWMDSGSALDTDRAT